MQIEDHDETIRKLEAERDAYLKALYAMTRNAVPPLTVEELQELQESTGSLSEIIDEIERELGPCQWLKHFASSCPNENGQS